MIGSCSRLRFECVGGRTTLVDCHVELPNVVLRPLRGPRGAAVVILLNPAGALFDADRVQLSVVCGAATDVTLVTAAATRLNRCDTARIEVALEVDVCAGAVFRALPHELIPFRGARYLQALTLRLAADARAQVLDLVAPGRTDQPFSYDWLRLHTDVLLGDTLCARERSVVSGRDAAARLRGFSHYGSLWSLGPGLDQAAAAQAAERLSGVNARGSATCLPAAGIALKLLGNSARDVRAALLAAADCPAWVESFLPP